MTIGQATVVGAHWAQRDTISPQPDSDLVGGRPHAFGDIDDAEAVLVELPSEGDIDRLIAEPAPARPRWNPVAHEQLTDPRARASELRTDVRQAPLLVEVQPTQGPGVGGLQNAPDGRWAWHAQGVLRHRA